MTELVTPIVISNVPAEMSKQLDSVLPEYKEKATYCITACCQATQAAKNAIGNFGEVSINDTEKMEQARRLRLDLAKQRTELVKNIKAEREKIQAKIEPFTACDKSFLKISQFVESASKAVELQLEQIEKTKALHDAEIAKKAAEARISEAAKYGLAMTMQEAENLSEQGFEIYIQSAKSIHENSKPNFEVCRNASLQADVYSQLSKWLDGINIPDLQADKHLVNDLKNALHNFKTEAAQLIERKKTVSICAKQ